MRVLGVVPYPPDQAPSQRYRLEQWLPRLRAHGIECDLVPFEDERLHRTMAQQGHTAKKAMGLLGAATRRWGLLSRVGAYDAVFLHREAMLFGPALIERLIARRRPMVFDFDDAIWMSNLNPTNPLAARLKFPGKTRAIVKAAAAVLAGNEYLADWARKWNPNTFVVPTTVETEGPYRAQKQHRAAELPVLGWTGSPSTVRYLEHIRPVLEQLATRRRFRLRLICAGPEVRWPGVDIEWVVWKSATEVEDLLPLDIGLMPQPDEEWAKGKCGFKALQYMALGIPAVASNNGVLPHIIDDGKNGLLAGSPAAWIAALERLIDDWQLRATLGARARETVRERYSACRHAPRVAEILTRLALPEAASSATRSG